MVETNVWGTYHECPSRSRLDLILIRDVMKNSDHAKTTVAAHNVAKNFPLLASAGVIALVRAVHCCGLLGGG